MSTTEKQKKIAAHAATLHIKMLTTPGAIVRVGTPIYDAGGLEQWCWKQAHKFFAAETS